MGVKGYKAFSKGMKCRDKKYEENTTYEENGSDICNPGVMHFCENPFDVLEYYPLVNENGEISDFSEVETIGDVFKDGNKSATNKLHIGLKLGLKGFVKACIDFTLEKTVHDNELAKTLKDNPNDSGNSAQIGSSGDYAKIGSSGDYAQIGSSGYSAKIGSSGNSAQIGSSGNSAQIISSGEHSVVMAAGHNSIAKAKVGSWITLAEWVEKDNKWIPEYVKTEYVDGDRIKEDTFYKLENHEFVEVKESEVI